MNFRIKRQIYNIKLLFKPPFQRLRRKPYMFVPEPTSEIILTSAERAFRYVDKNILQNLSTNLSSLQYKQ